MTIRNVVKIQLIRLLSIWLFEYLSGLMGMIFPAFILGKTKKKDQNL